MNIPREIDKELIPDDMNEYVAHVTWQAGYDDGRAGNDHFTFTLEQMQPLYDHGYEAGKKERERSHRDNLIGVGVSILFVVLLGLLVLGVLYLVQMLMEAV